MRIYNPSHWRRQTNPIKLLFVEEHQWITISQIKMIRQLKESLKFKAKLMNKR